jgi:shikimate dehydrogenase
MKAKFGLLGEVLGYSLSPKIHEWLFGALQLDARYDLIEISREAFAHEETMEKLRSLNGFNVTIPYKEMMIPLLDEIDSFAAEIGAVNTVLNQGGKLVGYNTDYYGFLESLKGVQDKLGQKKTAVILGTGGAAKMALRGLEAFGFEKIVFISRNPIEASKKFVNYECYDYSVAPIIADIMVNCTPTGQNPANMDMTFDASWFSKINFFFDLNYNPSETLLMKLAQSQGVQTMNGMRMLAVQAIKAEEIWWNRNMDVDALVKEVIKLIRS